MTIAKIPDEFPIAEIPSIPLWSENFALMAADLASNLSIFYSIGRWHGDPSLWREVVGITLPNTQIIYSKSYGRGGSAKTGPAGALSKYEVLEPGKRLKLSFDGPVRESSHRDLIELGPREGSAKRAQLELVFDAVAPIWDMQQGSVEAQTIAGAPHMQQIGKVNGTLAYDGQIHRFTDGYSIRDHSRGIRDVLAYRRHCWISGRFPEAGRAFHMYLIERQGAAGKRMANAAIMQDGVHYPAEVIHADLLEGPADVRKPHNVVLKSELGEMHINIAELVTSFPSGVIHPYENLPGTLPHENSALCLDEGARMRWDTNDGIGWSERAILARPFVSA